MLYTAEIYDATGTLVAARSAAGQAATPRNVLAKTLETRLPQLFVLQGHVGLTLPVVAAGEVTACVALVWEIDAWRGALELWRPYVNGTLRLTGFFYGAEQSFALVSQQKTFGVLEGLPGLTFDALEPVIFETLSRTRGFLRAEAAAAAGLGAGLGVPVMGDRAATCAVLLLSSAASPLANGFEVWHGDPKSVRLDSSVTLGSGAEVPGAESAPTDAEWVRRVFRTREPRLESCGARLRLAIPVFRGKTVGSVIVVAG